MEPAQGDQWPEARGRHAACCLNYGEDHPVLLIFGGMGKDEMNQRRKVLGDMWILDVDSGKWTEVRMLVYSKLLCDFRRLVSIHEGVRFTATSALKLLCEAEFYQFDNQCVEPPPPPPPPQAVVQYSSIHNIMHAVIKKHILQ